MKNARKVTVAQEILAQAKKLGFEDAYLHYADEDGNLYESIEDVARDTLDDQVTVSIELVLDEELTFSVEEEGDSSDDPPRITYVS